MQRQSSEGTVPSHFIRYCWHCSEMRARGLSPEGFVEWTRFDGHNALQTINNDNQRSLKVVCTLFYHETHRRAHLECKILPQILHVRLSDLLCFLAPKHKILGCLIAGAWAVAIQWGFWMVNKQTYCWFHHKVTLVMSCRPKLVVQLICGRNTRMIVLKTVSN